MRRPWLAALAATVTACSQLPTGPPIVPHGGISDEVGPSAAQTLYRVRYDGPEGDGSLRLVMRQVAPDRFQLQAADTFGRAVWGLDYERDEVLLLDHRRKEACVAGRELRVPEVALRPLPLPAVARVLSGRVPVPAPEGADPADWTDEAGQRWTARWEDGLLAAWTLWQREKPQLWWLRQENGGILSHRDGSQFRWRRTAYEKLLPSSYRRLDAPQGYVLAECEPAPRRAPGLQPG